MSLDAGLVWFRRDLRVADHAALATALRSCRRVHCVFVYDRAILDPLLAAGVRADRRVEFIHAAVEALDDALRERGGALTIVHGDASYEFGRPARFASNNFGAVLSATLAGAGIALVSDYMVGDHLKNGSLVRVLPEWSTHATEVHAVYPARQNLPPRLTLFLDHLARVLNPPPWKR